MKHLAVVTLTSLATVFFAAAPVAALAAENTTWAAAKPVQGPTHARHVNDSQALYDDPNDRADFDNLNDLVKHLIRTVVRHSKYRKPDALPMVTRVTREDLEHRACSVAQQKCAVSAVYESERGIMIAEDLKPETNLFHRSILLHEIVHYLQDLGHELESAAACDRWYYREIEAYAIQKYYLASINSPDRVAYSGSRPTCDAPAKTQTHQGQNVKAPGVTDQ